ncbi:MAG: hypothetical protein ABFS41_02430 [Myxococcota bacterium]
MSPTTNTTAGARARDRALSTSVPVALLGLLLVWIVYHPFRVNHDCAYLLEGAAKVLAGESLYVDFVDSNPPMIIYLNMIPAWAGKTLSVNPILPFSLSVFALVAWSTGMLRRLARRLPGARPGEVDVLSLLWVAGAFLVWQNNDFGQREHLFILLYFPFFLLRAVRWEGGAVGPAGAVALGVAAAIGVSLKPHFAFVAIAPELYWLATRRTPRNLLAPEVLAVAATAAAYGAHFLLLPEAVREEFFGRLIPLHLLVYHVYQSPLDVVLGRAFPLFVGKVPVAAFAGVAAVTPFLLRRPAPSGLARAARPLACVTAAAFGIYLYQSTGWRYHALPTFVSGLCVIALVGVQLHESLAGRLAWPRAVAWGAPLLVVLICGVAVWRQVQAGVAPVLATPYSVVVSRHSEPGDAIAHISTSLPPAYPALQQLDRRLANRYPCNLPVSFSLGLAEIDPVAARREKERYLRELAEDIDRNTPRLVFVDSDDFSLGCPPGFELWGWLSEGGFFEEALSGYRRLTAIPGHVVFIREG